MDNENLISVYLKLLGVLECPVCLDYLTKPVGLCQEGHALCSKCKINLTSCPMCRNPISRTRGLILDQIIETLLYPCYKMGCGSLVKRSEAEVHDQFCLLEIASDKQTVLHNNLLKNIEENFSSFLVQPEVPKETRTVGTVTGKVKTCDVRVQTVLPFLSTGYGQNRPESGTTVNCLPGSSRTVTNHLKISPSSGVSIASDDAQNLCAGSTKSAFNFPLNSVLDQKSGSVFMNTWNTSINAPDININSFQKSSVNVPQSFKGLWTGEQKKIRPSCWFSAGGALIPKPNPVSLSNFGKPSTNLNFNSANNFKILGSEPMDSNNGSATIKNLDAIASTSRESQIELIDSIMSNDEESQNQNSTINEQSTQLGSTLNNSSISNNNQPCTVTTTIGTSNKKKPSTNLYHIITRA